MLHGLAIIISSWIIPFERLHYLIIIVLTVSVLLSDKSPNAMLAWIFTIFTFPLGGAVLYLLFGINWRRNKIISKKMAGEGQKLYSRIFNFMQRDVSDIFRSKDFFYYNNLENVDDIEKNKMSENEKKEKIRQQINTMIKNIKLDNQESEIVKMLYEAEGTFLTNNNSYKLFFNGKEAFDSILEDIKNAKRTIYMEYFIWKADELGEKIKNALVEKAREGVKIRLLFDGVGTWKLPKEYKKELRNAGIETRWFLDVKFFMSKMNYRNHRKIALFDNQIVHTGGMNVGQEYIDGGKRFESWRDTNIRITGEIIGQYLAIFVTDWLNSGGKDDFIEDIKKEAVHELEVQKPIDKQEKLEYLMQVSSSGPDTEWTTLKYLYSKMIATAKEEVLIQSPYFVPDSALVSQLKMAALSGVKIKIMVTGMPDKKMPYWIAETYFAELIEAGIEIFRYKAGFLHSKDIIVDEKISTVGTCNFDMRSFEINYEVNAVFFNEEISKDLKKQFIEDLGVCEKFDEVRLKKVTFRKRLRNSIFKLISPIM